MPFRSRAKALLRSRPRSPPDPTKAHLSSSTKITPQESHTVYGSHEQIPGPKYRREPAKEHKEKLEAFSFADAWRKKSFQSARSPMGTRVSSRRNSFWSRKSSLVSSVGDGGGNGSVAAEEKDNEDDGGTLDREETVKAGAVGGQDSDTTLLQQQRTVQKVESAEQQKKMKQQVNDSGAGESTPGTARDHRPFSGEDLAQAMQRSRLEVPAQS